MNSLKRALWIIFGVVLGVFILAQGNGKFPYPLLGNYLLVGIFAVTAVVLTLGIIKRISTGIAYGYTRSGTSKLAASRNTNAEQYWTTIVLNCLWPIIAIIFVVAILRTLL